MSVAAYAGFVASCGGYGLAKDNSRVFNRVVAVDFRIPLYVHIQINEAVAGHQLKHMVEKPTGDPPENAPLPSRLMLAVISVSFVVRVILAVRISILLYESSSGPASGGFCLISTARA